jgi:hypothetical protein
MSTLELVKNGGACVMSTMSLIHNISFIFTKFDQQMYKKIVKNNKNGKMTNLGS